MLRTERAISLLTKTVGNTARRYNLHHPIRLFISYKRLQFGMTRPASSGVNGHGDGSSVVPSLNETVPAVLNDAKPDDETAINPAREARKREKELKKQEAATKAEAKKQQAAANPTAPAAGRGLDLKVKMESAAKKEIAAKKEKEKDVETPFLNTTPPGEMKGQLIM